MAIADEPLEGFALLDRVQKIRDDRMEQKKCSDVTVIFPMVDLDQEVDISWLLGMKLGSGYGIFSSETADETKDE